jgi:hypothetical protein
VLAGGEKGAPPGDREKGADEMELPLRRKRLSGGEDKEQTHTIFFVYFLLPTMFVLQYII